MTTLPDKHELNNSVKRTDTVPDILFLSDMDRPLLILPMLERVQLPLSGLLQIQLCARVSYKLVFNLPLCNSENVELVGWSNNALLLLQFAEIVYSLGFQQQTY